MSGSGSTRDKLRAIVRHEFSAVSDHSEAFVYLCENEARFVQRLPAEIVSAHRVLTAFIKAGQTEGKLTVGRPVLLADMLSGRCAQSRSAG